jgi:diguanylate cyclase (GGDEF)-like protein/PAS domain S-box-containing protein
MPAKLKVLLVEDEKVDQMAFTRFVRKTDLPYEATIAGSIQEARLALEQQNFDIVITDYFLGDDTALDLLQQIHDTPCIVLTGLGDEEIAVKAMKQGALDYLSKDADGNYLKMLPQVVENAIRLKNTERELVRYRENLERMVSERTAALTHTNQQLEREIGERKQAEAQVMLQATALESAVNGIMIVGRDGKVIWTNSSLLKMTGYSAEALLHQMPAFIAKVLSEESEPEGLWRAIEMGIPWYGETLNIRQDGSEFITELSLTPVLGEMAEITHFIAICNDITDKIDARQRLEYLATHDVLTDLPNRLLFMDRLSHAIAMGKRTSQQVAVLLIDLDDFKAINEAYSHDEGDAYLKMVAERIKSCLGDSDTLARIGGDEFAILLEDIDQDEVCEIAQKIVRALSEPGRINQNVISATASVGISMYPQDGDSHQTLLKNADLAMYQAKEEKNSFQFFNREMLTRIEKHVELTNYLRSALQQNLFELYYQPQVDKHAGRVIGLEALLRLPHSNRALISPAEIVRVAEKTGLIISIDEWVLKTAARKMRELVDAGFEQLKMCVNLSTRSLGHANLFRMLENALRENQLEARYIELEISESSVSNDVDKMIGTLFALKEMGFGLAVDDFGTGYASLNYLARFPLDTLKIDRSFTQKVLSSKSDAAIAIGVITIANSLGLEIVVEGVETRNQLAFFNAMGCHRIQGFLFSEAIPQGQLDEVLHTGFSHLFSTD